MFHLPKVASLQVPLQVLNVRRNAPVQEYPPARDTEKQEVYEELTRMI